MAVRRSGQGGARLTAALKELDGLQAKTGWFETAKYATGVNVAQVAAVHEFGATITHENGAKSVIPARPFMRPTVAEKGSEWVDMLAAGARSVLTGGATAPQVMEVVALRAAADVAKTISKITSPPLSPLTIARKGSTKPLVDTGQMIQAVTGIVEKKA